MSRFKEKIQRNGHPSTIREAFRNEQGAIDLASIMVGIIVIGLIGGVIAATVFAVIPWAQDNAAKQQLDSIVSAESAYMGLTSAVPPAIQGANHLPNSYGDSGRLADAKLLSKGDNYCVITTDDSKGYQAFSKSGSGNVFTLTDKNTKPVQLPLSAITADFKASLPADCEAVFSETTETPVEEVPPLVMTYSSAVDTEIELPLVGGEGVATWSDDPTPVPYNGTTVLSKNLVAGETYEVSIEGTVEALSYEGRKGAEALTAVKSWSDDLGVKSTENAFKGAVNLTDVPKNLPSTVTNTTKMFEGAASFGDTDVQGWEVSNVIKLTHMFTGTKLTETPTVLDAWNLNEAANVAFVLGESYWKVPDNTYNALNKTTTLTYKCDAAGTVKLPLALYKSDVTLTWSDGVTQTIPSGSGPSATRALPAGQTLTVVAEGNYEKFSTNSNYGSVACLRSVDHWGNNVGITDAGGAFMFEPNLTSVPNNVPSTITNMWAMFSGTTKFNQDISGWDTSNVENMREMFSIATAFNKPLNSWNTSNVTNMKGMFDTATSFNQPLNNWNTSKVTDMSNMFDTASAFNQPLNSWDVSKVWNMGEMFGSATKFNQDLNSWNTSSVQITERMFRDAQAFNGNISGWNVSNVTDMSEMFWGALVFDKPLNSWNVSKVTDMDQMFSWSPVFNQPLNNWDTSNVTRMGSMFRGATQFNQDLSGWNVSNVISKSMFGNDSKMTAAMLPKFK